jgi:hypothetical protein
MNAGVLAPKKTSFHLCPLAQVIGGSWGIMMFLISGLHSLPEGQALKRRQKIHTRTQWAYFCRDVAPFISFYFVDVLNRVRKDDL